MTEQPAASPTPGYEGWAVVELMGHRRRAGRVAEAEMFGTKLLRIDIPSLPPKAEVPDLGWDRDCLADGEATVADWGAHQFQIIRTDVGDMTTYTVRHCHGAVEVWRDKTHSPANAMAMCQGKLAKLVAAAAPAEPPIADLPVTTEFYGGAAIYALRPCSEAVARAMIERIGDPRPVAPVDYRAGDANGQRQLTYREDELEF